VRVDLACGPVAVKGFSAQAWLGSRLARRFGSKARRSWEVARALFERTKATPRPVACLERWEQGRLIESCFLAEQVDDTSTLHTELIRIHREELDYKTLLDLLETVAGAVRAMHDAGILHGDMGNQNIFVRRTEEGGYGDVPFIDLNRGRVREEPLALRERAFDLSRLTLPSRLRYLFSLMVYRERFFAGRRAPKGLVRWEKLYRVRFALHIRSRMFRHPIRSFRRWKAGPKKLTYPASKDIWIWDAHTSQAIGVWMRWEKLLHTSPTGLVRTAIATLVAAIPIGFGLWRAARGVQGIHSDGRTDRDDGQPHLEGRGAGARAARSLRADSAARAVLPPRRSRAMGAHRRVAAAVARRGPPLLDRARAGLGCAGSARRSTTSHTPACSRVSPACRAGSASTP